MGGRADRFEEEFPWRWSLFGTQSLRTWTKFRWLVGDFWWRAVLGWAIGGAIDGIDGR
jgi:hypothetical protein